MKFLEDYKKIIQNYEDQIPKKLKIDVEYEIMAIKLGICVNCLRKRLKEE